MKKKKIEFLVKNPMYNEIVQQQQQQKSEYIESS